MATVKTYILAPNFTYHPDTSICMGDIIQDPSDPTKPLSIPPDPSALAAESHIDYDAKFSEQKSHSLKGSIWATFLQTVSARSGGGVSGDVLDQYLGRGSGGEAQHDKARTVINSGIFGKSLVYMITGLKVARGFKLYSGRSSRADGNASFEAPMAADIGLGTVVSASSTNDVQQSYSSGQDIIFAYRLHVITYKGWRGKAVDITTYKPTAITLNEQNHAAQETPVRE